MRPSLRVLLLCCTLGAAASGCSGSRSADSVLPNQVATGARPLNVLDPLSGESSVRRQFASATVLHGTAAPATAANGIYVAEFTNTSMFGYSNRKLVERKGPLCTVPWQVSTPQDIAVDSKGFLIEPDAWIVGYHSHSPIYIGAGPDMCGSLAYTVNDYDGFALDASSRNVSTGVIAVANEYGGGFCNSGLCPGSISVCTVSAGCTANLTNSAMFRVVGVALARNGDCWASADNAIGTATLTYFKGCAGPGQQATSYQNPGYGGMDIDKAGNLVTISYSLTTKSSSMSVYSGCNPKCKLVGGPFNLKGATVYGHLNAYSTKFAAADPQYNQVDIYSYTPTALTYKYSFNKGLSNDVEGAAFNPPSHE